MYSWSLGADACNSKRLSKALCKTVENEYKGNDSLSRAYRGAGKVIASHLQMGCTETRVPALFDEFRCPLCDVRSPLRTFVWEQMPRVSDVIEITHLLMSSLDMQISEVVLAVVILESLLSSANGIFQPRSVRPILIASCSVACKVASDGPVTTSELCAAISDCFTNITVCQVARLEEQLLVLLDWHIPNDPFLYNARCCAVMKEGEPLEEEGGQCSVWEEKRPAFTQSVGHWFATPDSWCLAPPSNHAQPKIRRNSH
tara:strand:+ start:237 stop:1010 length:774 start_codon:yes stop_codon:yes gene_type:complete